MLQFFLLVFSIISYSDTFECKRKNKCPDLKDGKLIISSATSANDICTCTYSNTAEVNFDTNVYSVAEHLFYKVTAGTVKLTSSIQNIYSGAFNRANIRTIDFSKITNSLSISEGAFYHARFNSNVELSLKGFSSLPSQAFELAEGGTISFPSGLSSIYRRAFQNAKFSKVDFTKTTSPVSLGEYAFKDSVIQTFVFPSSISSSNLNTFSSCTINTLDLTSVSQFSQSDSLFFGANIKSIVVDDEITSVPQYLFKGSHIEHLDFTQYTKLKTIGTSAFEDAIIDRVTLTSSIETISGSAFKKCTINIDLSKATGLKIIGDYAFQGATITPTAQTFPNSLKSIGEQAFYETLLTSVTFSGSNNKLSIGDSAFKDIITLMNSDIHAKIINQNAFSGCINMVAAKISIEASGNIMNEAFKDCYNLNCGLTIAAPSGTLSTISTSAFENSGIQTISLPSMENIGFSSFKNCTKLAGGGALNAKIISSNAFYGDSELVLTSITAKIIGGSAFKYCTHLGAAITLIVEDDLSSLDLDRTPIGSDAFAYCDLLNTLTIQTKDGLDIEAYDKNLINKYLFSIGSKAFYRSGLVGPLNIPFTLTTVGSSAFAYCHNLTTVSIEGVHYVHKYIKENAFEHSSIGNDLVIPNSVVQIGASAFAFCPITSLTIHGSNHDTTVYDKICDTAPDGSQTNCRPIVVTQGWVGTKVGQKAFYECNQMTKLVLEGNEIYFDTTSFRECPIKDLEISAELTTIPKKAFYGISSITSKIEIPHSVTIIKESAFEGCSGIPSITFSGKSQLNTIEQRAFYGCTLMTSTNIPETVSILNDHTYYRCSSLKSINLPLELEIINNYVFYGCTNLDCTLQIPVQLGSIGNCAFYNCNKLKGSLEFPDSTTSIGNQAFYKCRALNNDLKFGRQINSIGSEAFRDCSGLSGNLLFPDYLYSKDNSLTINERAFYGCGFKGKLTLPQNTKFDGKEAFRNCPFTGDLILPEGISFNSNTEDIYTFRDCGFNGKLVIKDEDLTSIPEGTFQGCVNLQGDIPSENFVDSIGNNAFCGCAGLTGPLRLQAREIGNYAFCNCAGLTELICENPLEKVHKYAFYGCTGLTGTLDCTSLSEVEKYAFYGCSGLTGPINFTKTTLKIIGFTHFQS